MKHLMDIYVWILIHCDPAYGHSYVFYENDKGYQKVKILIN